VQPARQDSAPSFAGLWS